MRGGRDEINTTYGGPSFHRLHYAYMPTNIKQIQILSQKITIRKIDKNTRIVFHQSLNCPSIVGSKFVTIYLLIFVASKFVTIYLVIVVGSRFVTIHLVNFVVAAKMFKVVGDFFLE